MKLNHLSCLNTIASFFILLFIASESFSQPAILSTITKETGNHTSGYGRDLWFAIPLNFSPTDKSTKYFNIYVISLQNTTVNFQITGRPVFQKQVSSGQTEIFTSPTSIKPNADIPLTTELYSSGVVEQKAIHVWSDDADIAVYLLSRRDYSSGGMYVIPSIGWGTDYVVGAYESIFDPTGQADWPSEFAIVADQDNTAVTITPTWDLRKDGFPSVIEHPKNVSFSVKLNKGECVQYQTVLPVNDGECDVTGTIISSNNPIGVMGASVDPYIYFPYGYGDYCLSMLQPLRCWSKSYLTAPFAGRTYGGDAYCVIASQAQTIKRNGAQIAALKFKGDHSFVYDDVGTSPASNWTSDAPFELMQYIPSATFGTGNPGSAKRNQGDADMCSINPVDQFIKKVYFQIPTIDLASGQTEFTNYVNIILPHSHEGTTSYDSVYINDTKLPPNVIKKERFPIQNTNWEAIRLTYKNNAGEGMHIVNSDTGVCVYLYGYGTDDSYSWSGNLGSASINNNDTNAPIANAIGSCFSIHVTVSDSMPNDSKLNSIITDSLFNMSFTLDPSFIVGAGLKSSYYDLKIIDSTKEAYARIFTNDMAGNRTTVISTYEPQSVIITPQVDDFGVVPAGKDTCNYLTIRNSGTIPFSYQSIRLLSGNSGFTLDSTSAIKVIPVGDSIKLKICYSTLTLKNANDTLELSDGCTFQRILLVAKSSIPDFTLTDNDFKCVDIGSSKTDTLTVASNLSSENITIDSIWIDDTIHFKFNGIPQLPVTINVGANLKFIFTFIPDSAGNFVTKIHMHSIEAGIRTASIIGCGQIPASVHSERYSSQLAENSSEYASISSLLDKGNSIAILPAVPNPVISRGTKIRFIFGLSFPSPLDLSIYDILGNSIGTVIHSEYLDAGIYESDFPISALMHSGTYLYRLTGAGEILSGKFVILPDGR